MDLKAASMSVKISYYCHTEADCTNSSFDGWEGDGNAEGMGIAED